MRDFESLPDWLDDLPPAEMLSAMEGDPQLTDEILKHRRIERALRTLLASEKRVQRVKESVRAAVDSTPLDELKEQVLSDTSRPHRVKARIRIGWAIGLAAALVLAIVYLRQPKTSNLLVVDAVSGSEVTRDGSTLPSTASLGLLPGDTISTDELPLNLEFTDEATSIQLGPQTVVRILTLIPHKEFELVQGELDAEVAKQERGPMQWTTNNAIARVLGTKFALTADGVVTRLDVERGAVELQRLGSEDQTTVRGGEFAATDRKELLEASSSQSEPVWNYPDRNTQGTEHRSFLSKVGGMELGLNILLPPEYESQPERRYPVIYLLHDRGADEHTEAARFAPVMKQAMENGMPPFIAVFPNIGPGHTPRPWIMGQVLARDLANYVDDNFRTSRNRNRRVVAGMGQGGHRALMWAAMFRKNIATCIVLDETLRGGPPGIRPLLSRAQKRMGHWSLDVQLLHSQAESARDARALTKFLKEVGLDAASLPLLAPRPEAAGYAPEVWRVITPQLLQAWRKRPVR